MIAITRVALLLSMAVAVGLACRATDPRDDLRSAVDSVIHGDARREALTQLLDERDRTLDHFWSEQAEFEQRILQLNADYDIRASDPGDLGAAYGRSWEEHVDLLIGASIEARTLTSSQEWAALQRRDLDVLLASRRAR